MAQRDLEVIFSSLSLKQDPLCPIRFLEEIEVHHARGGYVNSDSPNNQGMQHPTNQNQKAWGDLGRSPANVS